ncbi:hypothetical protein G3N55_04835 [Dissulfurirhabdus thermomarina]|uniref:Hsp70 family protein n=1 Tax=Dissulfurirhabdus thermomarina TaxID=1765737 RepID=A0A6N9TLM1_DISTH|nr:rod shape-determining protein [Dissulfurirhabdus thermomarina]NDY42171.1 hypothetical protein [Dissulfurirhabdus thermomarina]NMX22399.1 hypothetical protein [Dissulfurirhabdus thermomarina]
MRLLPFGGSRLGLDPGASTVRVFLDGHGPVLEEPAVIARRLGGAVVAAGAEAARYLGRTPDGLEAVHPLEAGLMADYEAARALFRELFRRAAAGPGLHRPRVAVCTPPGATPVECRALGETLQEAGARRVRFLPGLLAAAVGAGFSLESGRPRLLLDLGYGASRAAVVEGPGIRTVESAPGGREMDLALGRWILEAHGLRVGPASLEHAKRRLGTARPPGGAEPRADVAGSRPGGFPTTVTLSGADVRACLAPLLARVAEAVTAAAAALEPGPRAVAGAAGLTLVGEGARLPGLCDYLREATGFLAEVADEPERAAARGAAEALRQRRLRPLLRKA